MKRIMWKKWLSAALAAAVVGGSISFPMTQEAKAAEGDTYVLMNIPYADFYGAMGVPTDSASTDYDAISSATNKAGNYGKAGGGFHSQVTAQENEDGSYEAVGGKNGARMEGVIWPVKVSSEDMKELEAAKGIEKITADSMKTVATNGKGKTSWTDLVSYETLMEAPAHSYYILDQAPDSYLSVAIDGDKFTFSAGEEKNVKTENAISVPPTYGTNWGDIQFNAAEAKDAVGDDANPRLVNAMVLTAKDSAGQETKVGFVHLYNIWSASEIAWKAETVKGLEGKQITNIRYYCSVKDADNTDGTAPTYVNYIYDYPVSDGFTVPQVYSGAVSASFDSSSAITVTDLPADAKNLKAKVYYSTGGRGAKITYLTPLAVDPGDGDIDPVSVEIRDGKIAIDKNLKTVTNPKGESQTYGKPVAGTEYTIEISSDNYIIPKVTAKITKADANLTVASASFSKTYGDAAFSLGAKADAALTYASDNTRVAAVDKDGKVTIKGAGTAKITVTAGDANHNAAVQTVQITVNKAAQKITVRKATRTYKVSALKKAKKTFKIGAKAKGKLTYKVTSGKKYLSVNKSGKVTVKKGAKKGTYKIKVSAKTTTNYKAAAKTITVKVKK